MPKRLLSGNAGRFPVDGVLHARAEKRTAVRNVKVTFPGLKNLVATLSRAQKMEDRAMDFVGKEVLAEAKKNPEFRKRLRGAKYTYVANTGELFLTNLPRVSLKFGKIRLVNSLILANALDSRITGFNIRKRGAGK